MLNYQEMPLTFLLALLGDGRHAQSIEVFDRRRNRTRRSEFDAKHRLVADLSIRSGALSDDAEHESR
jgi:hypothetical protein